MTDTVDDAASEPFSAGKQLSLIVDGEHVLYDIKKAFLPLTKSVVVLAQPAPSPGSSVEETTSPVIVKIYDPRVLDDRTRAKTKRPWSLAAEQRAREDRAREGFEWDDSVLYEEDPNPGDFEGLATRAAHWEQNFFQLTMQCYDSERAAYERLRGHQGATLPCLLGVGEWDVVPGTRAIRPPVLILEYVPSVSLREIRPDLLDPAICVPLLAAVDSFAKLGVCHTDLNEGNILFTPPEHPERAVIIDFGCAVVRDGDTTDAEWEEIAQFNADAEWLRRILMKNGVQLSAP